MTDPLILLTNDDGVNSPGLAALAAALDPLGDLLIVAPNVQQSAMGRSMPPSNNGRLYPTEVTYGDRRWEAYGAHASPAQAVQHGVLELADRRPALVVSGINYGENVGMSVTVSGTVGAAMEAAFFGIRAMAVSLQVEYGDYLNNDTRIDFRMAGHFARLFARRWLAAELPPDVDVLKIDVPAGATPETPWRVTHLERQPYFRLLAPERVEMGDEGPIGWEVSPPENMDHNSDIGVILGGEVSVTPLSLDMTSRIAPERLADLLNGD